MVIYLLGAVFLLGIVLLLSISLKKRKLLDVMLLSFLFVLTGFSFLMFTKEGVIPIAGLILSIVGFLLGFSRFCMINNIEMEKS